VNTCHLLARIGHHVLVLHKQEARLVVLESTVQDRVAFLEVPDQPVVAQEVLDVVGLCHPYEGRSALVDVANGRDDLGLVRQQVFEHRDGRCFGPVPRLVDHHRLVHVAVLRVHNTAQHGLDLLGLRCCLLGAAVLPRLERVEHQLAHAARAAGVNGRVLVEKCSKYRAARAGETGEEVEGFGH
jgi:hypothetical protein